MAKNTYVLGKRIARGGMAEIFMGKAVGEAAFQRICAIKRILPHYSQDKEFVEMFRDEAHICKRLQHANIVQVYDFTEVEGSYALIMEHVDGCDLRTLLSACEAAKTRISVPMALYITANSARALHYAHTKSDEITKEALGIVHRDISPQNILLSYEGEVKITDFGIASAENKITETRPGVVKGKYSYMSPEQVSAQPLDGRSDIFSLAIVLWEALAMRRLFAGQTEVESIRKVQNCDITQDLRKLNTDVDQELYKIVMKGLAKERKQRYQSASAFEKDLLKYLHSRYSEFTSSELGNFLKRILAKKRGKTQDDIKETLSQMQVPKKDLKKVTTPPRIQEKVQHQFNRSIAPTTGSRSSVHSFRSPAPKSMSTGIRRDGSALQPKYKNGIGKKRSRKLVSLGTFVFLVGLAFVVLKNAGSQKLQLKISTTPDTVMISVNGKKVYNTFTKTPAKIVLKPGNYQLELSRPGYKTESIRVRGKGGGTKTVENIRLSKLPGSRLVPVKVISAQGKIPLIINNGLYRGTTPLMVELLSGVKHQITFNFGDEQMKCSVRLRRTSHSQALKLQIRPLKQGKSRCVVK